MSRNPFPVRHIVPGKTKLTGSVHVVDEVAYDIIALYPETTPEGPWYFPWLAKQ